MSQVHASVVLLLATVALVTGCSGDPPPLEMAPEPAAATTPSPTATTRPTVTTHPTATTGPSSIAATEPAATPQTAAPTGTPTPAPPARPAWLGTRPLPLRDDGFGQVSPTPEELVDRRLPPPRPALLPPPPGGVFNATVAAVPDDVAARSTWSPACPVAIEDLAYVTVGFWGFDGRAHTGELLVHAGAADDLVEVFRRLFAARFPIEEMRITEPSELDAPPTGDGNNTTAFVCRPARGATSWSQHAYGLAVDINPFHNPYARGDLVLPELASAYTDRDHDRPGMVHPGGDVTEAFAAIGWGWGGDWATTLDWMHFSASGR